VAAIRGRLFPRGGQSFSSSEKVKKGRRVAKRKSESFMPYMSGVDFREVWLGMREV
jgi:hypothetical protein